uniref:RRM domain-containing protein n=1 Tax=Arundo donax TaxID=35708 RepID=A0A0A9GCV9_ARUDO
MKAEEPPQGGASTDPPPDEKPADGPAALILHFSNPEAIPSVDDINSIFRIHGPIMERETEITKKSKMAKVVFSNSVDAERAFSSSGKYNAFGPSLLTYEIKYLPSVPQVS